MRELSFIGIVAVAFGVGGYRLAGEFNAFSLIHLGVGILSLLGALLLAARSWGRVRQAARIPTVGRSLAVLFVVIATTVGLERLATRSGVRLDFTFETRYDVAPATLEALHALPDPVHMTVYYDAGDPRIRRTRILLEEIARASGRDIPVHQRRIEDAREAEDRFGIGNSNSVVIEAGDDWRLITRPTEGALFEGFAALGRSSDAILYITTGSGEGDVEDGGDHGFSGFAVALQTEGYDVRTLPSVVMSSIPEDADAIVMIRPARPLLRDALDALTRYLEAGGSLVAFIDPGSHSGLEEVLAEFGMQSPDAIVIDPLSDPVDGAPAGLSPIAFNYADHEITRGLQKNRSTVFRKARSFVLRKPQPNDRLHALVFASGYSWLLEEPLATDARQVPAQPASARADYHPLVVAGRYPRGQGEEKAEARIVAFGDAELVSNRYLRALYNLDLAMNAVAWAVAREDKISLRPKSAGLVQFPIPVQSSLEALYGVGLLVPEAMLMLGGVIWLRRRYG